MYNTAYPDGGPGRETFRTASNAPDSRGGPPAAKPLGGGAQTDEGRRHVLVVDDAPDVTEMIALMMSYAGYRVAMAFSATEAFDAARREQFDAVISDIGMPGMNGYQLAEALRALPAYQSTPLIAVTGFTQYEDRDRARRAGFDDFLTKPINPSHLIDTVKRLCG